MDLNVSHTLAATSGNIWWWIVGIAAVVGLVWWWSASASNTRRNRTMTGPDTGQSPDPATGDGGGDQGNQG